MSGRLADKVAVVSGFSSGIGRETALVFAREGASVFGADIDVDGARETVEIAAREGFKIEDFTPVDMFVAEKVRSFMNEVGSKHGSIDVLVNAAAFAAFAPLEDTTLEAFRSTMVGEIESVFYATQAAWPHLKARGGSVINFASVNAHQAVEGVDGIAHTAGKGGVLAMTRQIAFEGARYGIRANSISPGFIVTGATRPFIDADPKNAELMKGQAIIGRLGRPLDIANGCLFLASDESSFVTAADLRIDGGMTAR